MVGHIAELSVSLRLDWKLFFWNVDCIIHLWCRPLLATHAYRPHTLPEGISPKFSWLQHIGWIWTVTTNLIKNGERYSRQITRLHITIFCYHLQFSILTSVEIFHVGKLFSCIGWSLSLNLLWRYNIQQSKISALWRWNSGILFNECTKKEKKNRYNIHINRFAFSN